MNKTIKIAIMLTALASSSLIAACAQTATSESTGQVLDNSAITAKVKAAIMQDADLKVLDIHVETYKYTVQLSGFVDSQSMVTRAGQIARNVEGVKVVQNELRVK